MSTDWKPATQEYLKKVTYANNLQTEATRVSDAITADGPALWAQLRTDIQSAKTAINTAAGSSALTYSEPDANTSHIACSAGGGNTATIAVSLDGNTIAWTVSGTGKPYGGSVTLGAPQGYPIRLMRERESLLSPDVAAEILRTLLDAV